jgi:hypothetical protein
MAVAVARTARAGFLETRTARLKLSARKKPYWSRSGKAGVHIGYRRRKPRGRDAYGSWIARRYTGDGAYETEAFAEADDFSEADGASILTYEQAIAKLGVELSEVQMRTRYTVQNAIDDYIASLKLNAASHLRSWRPAGSRPDRRPPARQRPRGTSHRHAAGLPLSGSASG